jgi:hypothetical protein
VLHLLATCLERNFHALLEMTARSAESIENRKSKIENLSIQMPDTFDVEGPEFSIATGKDLLPLFAQYGLNSAAVATLEKIFTSWIRNPSQELWDKVKGELDALEKASLKPQIAAGEGK